MPRKQRLSAQQMRNRFNWESTILFTGDYEDGPDEETNPGTNSQPIEVFNVVVGESAPDSSQLQSYEAVRLGRPLGQTGDSARGKLYAALADNGGAAAEDDLEFRWVARPRNGNQRTPLTEWFVHADANQSDVDKRLEVPPVKSQDGAPLFVRAGTVLAVEVRTNSTGDSVDRANSELRIPAMVGY